VNLDNKSILIVDDIFINRHLLAKTIKLAGFKVFEAENGKKAIEILKNQYIDIILMDIEMPVMNGIETVHFIRKELSEPQRSAKIYALTAYNNTIISEHLNLQEFDGIITKPYDIERIQEILK
jgi:CheY-like chemotaxis protein